MRNRPLTVRVEKGELVIRIGINTLARAANECPLFYNGEKDRSDVKIINAAEWAEDIVRALDSEEDDGTTPVHSMLDKAFSGAVDDGSLAVGAGVGNMNYTCASVAVSIYLETMFVIMNEPEEGK